LKVGRHGDHGLLHRVAEVVLGDDLGLLEDHGAYLRDAVGLVPELDPNVGVGALDDGVAGGQQGVLDLGRVPLPTDEALGRVDGVLRVGDGLRLAMCPTWRLPASVTATMLGVVL
jgi:hypothetical protein